MSFRYSRVYPTVEPHKFYGFKKVNEDDLRDIVSRLQKPTVTSLTHHDIWKKPPERTCATPMPKQPRPPSSKCRKVNMTRPSTAPPASSNRPDNTKLHYDDKMIARLVRRLQRPTLSKMLANGKIRVEYGDEIEAYQEKMRQIRPKSGKEQTKALERVQRPTTASRRHIAINESVVDKNPDEDLLLTQYSSIYKGEERFLTKDEEKEIVSRVAIKTNAFCGGEPQCPKVDSSDESLTFNQRKQYGLPLVSGLSRSQNTQEITSRVYVSNESEHSRNRRAVSAPSNRPSRNRSHTQAATPIYVY